MASINERDPSGGIECGYETPDNICPIARSEKGENCKLVFECFRVNTSNLKVPPSEPGQK